MEKDFNNQAILALVLLVIIAICSIKIWGPSFRKPSAPPKTTTPSSVLLPDTVSEPEKVAEPNPDESKGLQYIEVQESCGPYYGEGPCVNLRSGPGEEHPVVMRLRTGMVLRVGEIVTGTEREWRRIIFDEWLRYPERLPKDLFVAEEYIRPFLNEGNQELKGTSEESMKKIIIDRGDQKLYAYDGDQLFMDITISTGLQLTPTPAGTFTIFRKMPSRYMQGPVPELGDDYYDLPGVPWVMYFTHQGGAIHGTYWHNSFGQRWSHGCVNLMPEEARELYTWADLGTKVVVTD